MVGEQREHALVDLACVVSMCCCICLDAFAVFAQAGPDSLPITLSHLASWPLRPCQPDAIPAACCHCTRAHAAPRASDSIAGVAKGSDASASMLPGTSMLHATRPRHLLHSLGGVLTLLPLFLLANLPSAAPPCGHLTNADVGALLDTSEIVVTGDALERVAGQKCGLDTAAGGHEAEALREFARPLMEGFGASARLLDAIATLQARYCC
jgi:hypothetical protein